MACSFKHERALRERGISIIAGIDEAGRGPLAGPVVAAAVVLPAGYRGRGLDDSKKLTAAARLRHYERLTTTAGVIAAVAVVEVAEIDRLNILRAAEEAMRRALGALSVVPQHVLIDGRRVHPFPVEQTALPGGDGISLSIAAASVIAKVTRDRRMEAYATEFPEYGFDKHKGYTTAEHLAALRTYGPSPIHRRSFEPVARRIFQFE